MKQLFLFFGALCFAFVIKAQQSASSGTIYGEVKDKGDIVSIDKLETTMKENKYYGKISGKVIEVCQAMGCWVKLQKADGSAILVKSKEHGFTMPKDIVGKNVIVDGEANATEISETMRKHYAADGGKNKDEIEKIKGSSKEITITANGVKVI